MSIKTNEFIQGQNELEKPFGKGFRAHQDNQPGMTFLHLDYP